MNRIVVSFCISLYAFLSCSSLVMAQEEKIQQLLNRYSSDSIQKRIQQLSGEIPVTINGQSTTITSRLYNDPGNERTFQFAKEQFGSWGYYTGQHVFSTNGKNFIAFKYGTENPDNVCIIGAHYDDLPQGPVAPGADDNASGVAAVMEIARIIAHTDFPNTVVFILWDEEELGLIGSSAYTSGNIIGETLLGYINVDMLGWDSDNDHKAELHVRPVANSLSLAELVLEAQQEYNIDLDIEVVNPGAVNSDHYSFWVNGYTAVGINEEYSGDINPYRHSTSDTYATLNLPYLDENVKLAMASYLKLAYLRSETDALKKVLVYPNPSYDELHFAFGQTMHATINLQIYDNTGRLLLEQEVQNINQIDLSIKQLETGRYFACLSLDNEKQITSFIKL